MPEAISWRMRITGLIGLLMMLAVNSHPDDWRAHVRKVRAGAYVVFEPFGHGQRLVSEKTMVSQSDSDAMPVMPKNRPGDYHQTGRKDRIVKDAQSEFLCVSQ